MSALEATGYLAPLLYVQGRLREAVVLCEDALRAHTDPAGRPLPMAGLAEVPLGTLLYERDELGSAQQHLQDGIARCEQLGTTSYTLLGLRTLARLHVVKGAVDEGFRALLTARRQADAAEDGRRARLVIATIAELNLRTGNPAAAEQALREIADDHPSSSDYEQLTRARLFSCAEASETGFGGAGDDRVAGRAGGPGRQPDRHSRRHRPRQGRARGAVPRSRTAGQGC